MSQYQIKENNPISPRNLQDNKEVFRTTVQRQPAALIPFKLNVDDVQWRSKKNQTKARPMTVEKATNLKKMIDVLLEHGVIEPSTDGYYSHAFLVPKPNGKWRLVLDFTNLNAATVNQYLYGMPWYLQIDPIAHGTHRSR